MSSPLPSESVQLSLLHGEATRTGQPDETLEHAGLTSRILGSGVLDLDRRVMAAIAGAVLILILVVSIWPEPRIISTVEHTLPPDSQGALGEIAPDSLGLALANLTEQWNSLEHPPLITGGLLHSPEGGRFDSFRYRFSDQSVIAGAYDPDDGHIYALLVSTRPSLGGGSQMIIHLCHLLHPFSPECLDGYFQSALAGKSATEYAEIGLDVTWDIGDERWRVTIEGDVETIRVQSPVAG